MMVSAPVATFVVLHKFRFAGCFLRANRRSGRCAHVKLSSQNVSPTGREPLLSGTLLTAFANCGLSASAFSLRTPGILFWVARCAAALASPCPRICCALPGNAEASPDQPPNPLLRIIAP